MHPERPYPNRGSALLLVLWSLILLSMSVFGVVEIVESSVSHASHLEQESRARALALSGLAVALDPDMPGNDSLLNQQPAADEKWSVSMQGEGARLNLNEILLKGHREVLARLFVSWGLHTGDATHVADCLYDWITPGKDPSPQGAKAVDYQRAGLTELPTGRPFASLPEVRFVMGMDLVEKAKPDWQDSFTLWSDGPLDVNEAPPELIAALCHLPPSQVEAFAEVRNGKDGIVGTPDDVAVPDMAGLRRALGLSKDTADTMGSEISFTDGVRRVKSRGEANGISVTISVITRLKTSPPEYLSWNEL
jgi:type II secretory pathway component PulK